MSEMSEIPRAPKTKTWRRFALTGSFALNLFFLAVIGGHVLHNRFGLPSNPAVLANALRRAEALLSPPDAAAFSAVMHRDSLRFEQSAQRLSVARKALERQIGTEPFDKEAVQKDLAAWRQQWNAFFDDFRDALVDALAQVSPEGRRRLIADRQKQLNLSPP